MELTWILKCSQIRAIWAATTTVEIGWATATRACRCRVPASQVIEVLMASEQTLRHFRDPLGHRVEKARVPRRVEMKHFRCMLKYNMLECTFIRSQVMLKQQNVQGKNNGCTH
jgi:hypothetical protein